MLPSSSFDMPEDEAFVWQQQLQAEADQHQEDEEEDDDDLIASAHALAAKTAAEINVDALLPPIQPGSPYDFGITGPALKPSPPPSFDPDPDFSPAPTKKQIDDSAELQSGDKATDRPTKELADLHNRFNLAIDENPGIGVGNYGTFDKALREAAEVHTETTAGWNTTIEFISKRFARQPFEVERKLTEAIEALQTSNTTGELLSNISKGARDDYDFLELCPSTPAQHILNSCEQTKTEPIASLVALYCVLGGLVGSKVQIRTGQASYTPVPIGLYSLIAGSTSAKKSILTDHYTGPLRQLQAEYETWVDQRIDAIDNDPNLENLQKRQAKDAIEKNRADFYYEPQSFSAEAVCFDLAAQEPNGGFCLFLDEGSQFNSSEGYSNAAKGGSGANGRGLIKNTFISAYKDCLQGKMARRSKENAASFRQQVPSALINCQYDKISTVLDMVHDEHGWASRWILVRANRRDALADQMPTLTQEPPISRYVRNRLVPFCQSIKPQLSDQKRANGSDLRHFTLLFSPEAQEVYNNDVFRQMELDAAELRASNVEGSLVGFVNKRSLRVAKLASADHIISALINAQEKKIASYEIDESTVEPAWPANERIDTPISLDSLRRAMKLNDIIEKEFRLILDEVRLSDGERQAKYSQEQKLAQMAYIIGKVKQAKGPVKEAQLKANLKSTYCGSHIKITAKELGDLINHLVQAGHLQRTTKGKGTKHLSFIKGLRD